MKDVGLITLEGQGDLYAFCVDLEIFDWVVSHFPWQLCDQVTGENKAGYDPTTPPALRKLAEADQDSDGPECHVGPLSCINDRALFVLNYGALDSKYSDDRGNCWSIKTVHDMMNKEDWNPVKEFSGYIY